MQRHECNSTEDNVKVKMHKNSSDSKQPLVELINFVAVDSIPVLPVLGFFVIHNVVNLLSTVEKHSI